MPRALLWLNAMRTFEAVARHRSLTRAARELLERGPPLKTPADLVKHTLLHVNWSWVYDTPNASVEDTQTCEDWFRAVGVDGATLARQESKARR